MKMKVIRGKDRKGVQTLDYLEEIMKDDYLASPRYEKPAAMIESIRVVGKDIMTAKDSALYELLLSYARKSGIEKESHEIDVATCLKFLGVAHTERLLESIERITSTLVRYDFMTDGNSKRHRGSIPLILAEVTDDLRSGTSTLTYAIPPSIRKVILESRQYGLLEIRPFAQFRCKYTARLYQKLAFRAGMTNGYGKIWELTPLELAELVDYPIENFRYFNFEARCLMPVLEDIKGHVRRFSVDMTEVRGSGRGRPVEKVAFKITQSTKEFEELSYKKVTATTSAKIRDDETGEMPSAIALGRACKLFHMNEAAVLAMWKAFIEYHRAIYSYALGLMRLEALIIQKLDKQGADAAFKDWVNWHQIQNSVPSYDFDLKAPEDKTQPSAKPLHKFGFPVPKLPVPKSAAVDEQDAEEMKAPDVVRVQTSDGVIEMTPDEARAFMIAENAKSYPTRAEMAKHDAEKIMKALRNECLIIAGNKKTYEDSYFTTYLDHESPPWCWLELDDGQERRLRSALWALKKTDSRTMRHTLRALLTAAAASDVEKIDKIAKAIYARKEAGELPVGDIRKAKGPNNGTNSTQQVTELSVEYDFSDPAYGYAVSVDDIDHPDADNT